MTQVKFWPSWCNSNPKKKLLRDTMYHNLQSVNVHRFITIKKTYLQTEHKKKKKHGHLAWQVLYFASCWVYRVLVLKMTRKIFCWLTFVENNKAYFLMPHICNVLFSQNFVHHKAEESNSLV